MRSTLVFSSVVASAALTSAHGIVSDLKIGGQFFAGYNPFQDSFINPAPERIVRPFPTAGNGPVENVLSNDIVCNKGASSVPAPISAKAEAGSEITFFWTVWPESHQGPTMTYLAPCNGPCSEVTAAEDLEWFKIDHAGLLPDGKFISDSIIANNNSYTVTIPSDIAAGEYMIRHELLALHSAGNPNGAQFYPMCANLEITGGGSAKPKGVKFPGAYQPTDPGILVNIFFPKLTSYTIPGPDVYKSGGSTAPEVPETPEPTTAPEPTEVPEAPEPTTAPEPTEAPEAPEPTTAPEPTEAPEAPEPTSAPEPTQAPEPSVTSPAGPTSTAAPANPTATATPDNGSLAPFPEFSDRASCFDAYTQCMTAYRSCMRGGANRAAQVTCENYRLSTCEAGRSKCDGMAAN